MVFLGQNTTCQKLDLFCIYGTFLEISCFTECSHFFSPVELKWPLTLMKNTTDRLLTNGKLYTKFALSCNFHFLWYYVNNVSSLWPVLTSNDPWQILTTIPNQFYLRGIYIPNIKCTLVIHLNLECLWASVTYTHIRALTHTHTTTIT